MAAPDGAGERRGMVRCLASMNEQQQRAADALERAALALDEAASSLGPAHPATAWVVRRARDVRELRGMAGMSVDDVAKHMWRIVMAGW